MGNIYNTKLRDVLTAYKSVSDHGTLNNFKGEPLIPNMVESHVQGIVCYRKYVLLTHNNKGYSKGFIIVLNAIENKMVYKFETPNEHFNHPAGMQLIGDYLIVPVENSKHEIAYIHFYDLSSMTDETQPVLIDPVIMREKGAGAAGITNYTDSNQNEFYLLAAYDNGALDFYKSEGYPITNPTNWAGVTFSVKLKNTSYSSINLLTDVNNNIYLLAFRTHNIATTKKDFVDIFQVDIQNKSVTALPKDSRHMYNKYGGVKGMDGVHFRWAAGLQGCR